MYPRHVTVFELTPRLCSFALLTPNATFLTHRQRLECYGTRYKDLFRGYCNSDFAKCDWAALQYHWDHHGQFEGREFDCSHVKACTAANMNLLNLVDEDKVPYNMCAAAFRPHDLRVTAPPPTITQSSHSRDSRSQV